MENEQGPPGEAPAVSLEDARVISALEDYQAALEGGRPASSRHLLGRFPEIAAELKACLEGMELLYRSGINGLGACDEASFGTPLS